MDCCEKCKFYRPIPEDAKELMKALIGVAAEELPDELSGLTKLGEADGQCRIFPPTKGCNEWPMVTVDGWCGSFKIDK